MNHAQTMQSARCERVVVTAADGRVFDLGSPNSRLFKLRVWLYKKKRGISRG
jgi:hypothetical protein